MTAEQTRLTEDAGRQANWKRWGPYLSERQWATVREDYSPYGTAWDYFPHDHARSRAYRWGEDGLLGITDRQCRLCFALALWNGQDPILKERLFGLTGNEGNHGEDVKELYYYLDSTPTHSYMKALYKYPQAEFPYGRLVDENRRAGLHRPEVELIDLGAFHENRYFDVLAEYAKASPEDILIRLTLSNRGPEAATLHVLPTLWFRNTWSWGSHTEDVTAKPVIRESGSGRFQAEHLALGHRVLAYDTHVHSTANAPQPLFTDNVTNAERLFGGPSESPHRKDAFHEYVIHHQEAAVNPGRTGTKAAPHYILNLGPGESTVIKLRLFPAEAEPADALGSAFDHTFGARITDAEEFYSFICPHMSDEEKNVSRQGYAGLLWTKQFYHYVVEDWLHGDSKQPPPPQERLNGRNRDWGHLFNRDVVSVCDKWEYPWYAAWDLSFHMIPFAKVDPDFAKEQLSLFLREWYMHPNGQIPAYEWAFGDVNPPVHAWAAWRVYKMTGKRGDRDRGFLESIFHKLLLNFTWWVNRKDIDGNNLFSGGFLGMDNVGVFDRSAPLPTGGHLQQADGTAWMAFYCLTMLSIALELAQENPTYEDMASKFFEHFIEIADAMNEFGGTGLWDEQDGFYYDRLKVHDESIPLKTRSLVGLMPLVAVEVLREPEISKLPGFSKRMRWFLNRRWDLLGRISACTTCPHSEHRILAIPSRERLQRALQYMLDENEFLSPYGIRSVSKVHLQHPYIFNVGGHDFRVDYVPGEGTTYLFGGNSNWRGPIWFPINFLLVEALERYHYFYGDDLKVECPRGSGRWMNLQQAAEELARRMASIFMPDAQGHRPCHGEIEAYRNDPHFRDKVLFYEYFHAETGRGCGASHQTGWTALAVKYLDMKAKCTLANPEHGEFPI
jgi:hypothetical protein